MEKPVSEDLLSEEPNDVENPIEEKPDNSDVEEEQVENPEELDLGLPDPEETHVRLMLCCRGPHPHQRILKQPLKKVLKKK